MPGSDPLLNTHKDAFGASSKTHHTGLFIFMD